MDSRCEPFAGKVLQQRHTNGVLVGYTVQKDGQVICEDPTAYIQFRGPQSYIVCE